MGEKVNTIYRQPIFTRRGVLRGGLVAGTGIAIAPWLGWAHTASPAMKKFVDPLPIPPVIQPVATNNGVKRYLVQMTQFQQKVHRDLPATPLWGYDGSWPGPTFEIRSGEPISVTWINNLPYRHLLEYAYDTTIHGADMGEPHARTVVHLHGAKVLPDSDGYPEAWFTRGWSKTGPFFTSKVYDYPNDQDATNLWYHDHSLGITRLNVFAGLAGLYFIRDRFEDQLNLPSGNYEVPLLIQDRMFNPDGSLQYPTAVHGTHDVWVPEFFGDVACVNGKAFPYLEVEPRKYRFRMVNGSNARFYHLTLADRFGNPGPLFNQIGSDGGLLPAPVVSQDLLIAPAERFDLVIDFGQFAGKTLTLFNDAPDPFPGGGEVGLPEVMQFRVAKRLAGPDRSDLPSSLRPIKLLKPSDAVQERFIMLSEWDRDSDGFPVIGELGGSPTQATNNNPTGGARWDDPVSEAPAAGSTEIWNLVNVTTDGHPIHVHLVQFNVLDRRTFDLNQYFSTGVIHFTGAPIPPEPNERPANKDTVKAYSGLDANGNVIGLVTRIIIKFDLPVGTKISSGEQFRYIYHCHILEHEDNEMMRPYNVVGSRRS